MRGMLTHVSGSDPLVFISIAALMLIVAAPAKRYASKTLRQVYASS
jgi:hypothetical protein